MHLATQHLRAQIPSRHWNMDEGTNRYIVVCQCPRTPGRVTNFTTLFPQCSLLLAHFIHLIQPEPVPYTTPSIRTGPGKPPHRDARNSHAPSTIIGFTDYTKRRLWIEHPEGTIQGWAPGSLDRLYGFFTASVIEPSSSQVKQYCTVLNVGKMENA